MKNTAVKTRKGSAIIVALLVMAILLTMTLSLSLLMVSEMRQTGDVVAAGKAYYAAEAGIENALLDLSEHLPGYQTTGLFNADDSGWVNVEAKDPAGAEDGVLSYNYRIRNQGDRYPYFDADKPIYLTPGVGITKDNLYDVNGTGASNMWATYSVLPLNQTVTIPLYTACPDGITYRDVTGFVLEYYVDFDMDKEKDNPLDISSVYLQDFDILRWKLFGEPTDAVAGGPTRTDAISDFYPALEGDGPDNPVCIGTDPGLAANDKCNYPIVEVVDIGDEPVLDDWKTFSSSFASAGDPVISGVWSQARECYTSDAGQQVAPSSESVDGSVINQIKRGCSIDTFVKSHRRNYITITNVVNPEIIGISDPDKRNAKANIFYRLVASRPESCPGAAENQNTSGPDDNFMVRPAADISADGFASDGKVKQSIDAKLKLNSFLPVFNFTLFRTDPSAVNPEDRSK